MDIHYKVLAAIATLLFLAAAPLPYGFYTFLKIVVFLAAGYMAYQGYLARQQGIWPWLWGVVAIIFNPIVVIAMDKEVWMIVNVLTGMIFAFVAFRAHQLKKKG